MPLWRRLLLDIYYHATEPVRAWTHLHFLTQGRIPVIVLYWHRIADDRANPWTTRTDLFERQIDWLQSHFRFVSLEEAQRRVRSGENHESCVCVTFDDGYADNCRRAIPLLIDRGIPFAYFVTVQNTLEQRPFIHDIKLGHSFQPNTIEQLRWMAAAGGEIGSHAFTHASLGEIAEPALLRREIVESKSDLETALGQKVRYFAFPYGMKKNLSCAAFDLAKATGFAGVCSAYGGFNFPGDDAFHLQRISADGSLIRMKNWVTFDPRKLHTPRFNYQSASSASDEGDSQGKAQPDSEGNLNTQPFNLTEAAMLPMVASDADVQL